MKNDSFTIHLDGVVVRRKNKRITIRESDDKSDSFMLEFYNVDGNNRAACKHFELRNKGRVTIMKISHDAMDDLLLAYIKHKEKPPLPTPPSNTH